MVEMTKVPGGIKNHKVVVFALSTCGWCKKMKRLLAALDVEYMYCDLDLLSGQAKEMARQELKKHNPSGSTPTVVVDGDVVVVGFREDDLKEALS
jgi:glutaredoxin